jgi:hypothetical protein
MTGGDMVIMPDINAMRRADVSRHAGSASDRQHLFVSLECR